MFVSTLCSGGKHWDFNIDMEEGQPDNQVSWQNKIRKKELIYKYIVLHICRTLELKIAKLQSVFVVVHIYTYILVHYKIIYISILYIFTPWSKYK